ncbi:MAG: SDR family NAD(P)-dependent oxidoreductase [Saprospiraceae bacterium]
MLNKTCVITGCNSGIGLVASLELARQGFELFMLMREGEKSERAYEQVRTAAEGGKVHYIPVNLSSMAHVYGAAQEVLAKAEKVDLLINNAGVLVREEKHTSEGLELTLAVNYYAPYVLTRSLLPLLFNAESGRIVNVSSAMSKRGKILFDSNFEQKPFSGIGAYANSKLLVNYLTYSLSDSCDDSPIVANCLHPGMVNTGVFRKYPKWLESVFGRFLLTPKQGAQHLLLPAVNPSLNHYKGEITKKISGIYFNKAKAHELSKILKGPEEAAKIWKKTQQILEPIPGLEDLWKKSCAGM